MYILDLSTEDTEILVKLVEYIDAIDSLQFGFLFDPDCVRDIRDEFNRRTETRTAGP